MAQGVAQNLCEICLLKVHWNNPKIRIIEESVFDEAKFTPKERKGKMKFRNIAIYHKECYEKNKELKDEKININA